MLKREESKEESCRAISYFLRKCEFPGEQSAAKELLLRDLCARASELEALDKAIILAEAFQAVLPATVQRDFDRSRLKFDEFDRLRREKKEKKSVGIVTVRGPELRAILAVMGKPIDADPEENSGEYSYWFANIKRSGQDPLSVVITMVAETRNVPCAIAVEHLLNDYDVDLLVLVGIAAGPRSKVKLGDVVCSREVYDYEHYRLELTGTKKRRRRPRPTQICTRKQIKIALERLDKQKFLSCFKELLTRTPLDRLPKGSRVFSQPELHHDATIAAGEKLFADGSLEKMRLCVDERIRAGAMEDSGFAQVAEARGKPWCIFRGISDYGDPKKGGDWQFISAMGAGCAALSFLRSTWLAEAGDR